MHFSIKKEKGYVSFFGKKRYSHLGIMGEGAESLSDE